MRPRLLTDELDETFLDGVGLRPPGSAGDFNDVIFKRTNFVGGEFPGWNWDGGKDFVFGVVYRRREFMNLNFSTRKEIH